MDLHMGPVHRWAPVSPVTISVRLQTELIIEVTSIKLEREAKQKDQREEWGCDSGHTEETNKKIPDQMLTGSQKWETWAAKGTHFNPPQVTIASGQVEHKHSHNFHTHHLNSRPHGTIRFCHQAQKLWFNYSITSTEEPGDCCPLHTASMHTCWQLSYTFL